MPQIPSHSTQHQSRLFGQEERILTVNEYIKGHDGGIFHRLCARYGGTSHDGEINQDFVQALDEDLQQHGILWFPKEERTAAAIFAAILFGERYIDQCLAIALEKKNYFQDRYYHGNPLFEQICNENTLTDTFDGDRSGLFNTLLNNSAQRSIQNGTLTRRSPYFLKLMQDPDFRWYGVSGLIQSLHSRNTSVIRGREYPRHVARYVPFVLKKLGIADLGVPRELVAGRFAISGAELELTDADPFGLQDLKIQRVEREDLERRTITNVGGEIPFISEVKLFSHPYPQRVLDVVDWLNSQILSGSRLDFEHKAFLVKQAFYVAFAWEKDQCLRFLSAIAEPYFWQQYLESLDKDDYLANIKKISNNSKYKNSTILTYVARKETESRVATIARDEGGSFEGYFGLETVLGEESIYKQFDATPRQNYRLLQMSAADPEMQSFLKDIISELTGEESPSFYGKSAIELALHYRGLHSALLGEDLSEEELLKEDQIVLTVNGLAQQQMKQPDTPRGKARAASREKKIWQIVSQARNNFVIDLYQSVYPRAVERIINRRPDLKHISPEIQNAVKIWYEVHRQGMRAHPLHEIPFDQLSIALRQMVDSEVGGSPFSVQDEKENKEFFDDMRAQGLDTAPWLNGFRHEVILREPAPQVRDEQVAYYREQIDRLCAHCDISTDELVDNFYGYADRLGDRDLVRDVRLQVNGLKMWQDFKPDQSVLGQRVTLYLETSPIRQMMLGSLVDHSCYRSGGGNAWNAVAIALNGNLGVVYGKLDNGQIIGRRVLALNKDFQIQQYVPHYRGMHNFEDSFEEFAALLAKSIGTRLADSGEVPTPATGIWSDDAGPQPFRFQESVKTLPPIPNHESLHFPSYV